MENGYNFSDWLRENGYVSKDEFICKDDEDSLAKLEEEFEEWCEENEYYPEVLM